MTRDDLAVEIVNVHFAQTSPLSRGYDVRAVDDLLDRLRDRVLAGASAEEVEGLATGARFDMGRSGYAVEQVDDFLARLPAQVRGRGADARPDSPNNGPNGPVAPLPSAVIKPAPGLFGRLLRGLRGS